MVGRMRGLGWIGAVALAVTGAGPGAAASEPGARETGEAYRMTLQILGGMASCGDEWSGPEYYGAATRQDPEVEEELGRGPRGAGEAGAQGSKHSMNASNPCFPGNTIPCPLSEDEQQELEALRERGLALERELKERAQQLSYEERRTLEGERSKVKRSVRRLEDAIPLTEAEVRFLRDQKEQRAPLAERREFLKQQEDALTDLISMTTPGSLQVYPNDSLRLRLMEKDAFADDTCATWQLTLDREILGKRWRRLGKGRPRVAEAVGSTGSSVREDARDPWEPYRSRILDTGHAYIYPTPMVDTVLRVFQYVPPLIAVTEEDWQKFCGGTIPLQAELPGRRIHVLVVTLLAVPTGTTDGGENACRSIEPFLVDVDASGYLVPKDATLPPLSAAASSVIDLRPRLLFALSPPRLRVVAADARSCPRRCKRSAGERFASGAHFLPFYLKSAFALLCATRLVGHSNIFRQRT